MRRLAAVLTATAILMAMTLSASAAIHPIVCSGNAGVPNGLVDNPARGSGNSSDIGNPPGLTPDAGDGLHDDDRQAGDFNPNIRDTAFGPLSPNQFAPLLATGFTGQDPGDPSLGPQYFKTCGRP